MTIIYAPEEVIETVTTLTAERLSHFESLHIVTPVHTQEGPRYHQLDIHRITLLCELTDDFEVNEDALVIIMSLPIVPRQISRLTPAKPRTVSVSSEVGKKIIRVKAFTKRISIGA